jgi:hypothetical protein
VTRVQRNARIAGDPRSVPQAQRRPPASPLGQIVRDSGERNAAMVAAYATDASTYREIAEHFGAHLATGGRLVRRGMQQCKTLDPCAGPLKPRQHRILGSKSVDRAAWSVRRRQAGDGLRCRGVALLAEGSLAEGSLPFFADTSEAVIEPFGARIHLERMLIDTFGSV